MKRIAVVVAFFLVLSGCEQPAEPPRAEPSPTVFPSTPAERPVTRVGVKVNNRATGMTARHIERAIRDLKRLGFWKRLTKGIYVVSIGSRPGRQYVPDDGHLAEARGFSYVDDDGGGRLCDITFFPTAMNDDLILQKEYYDRGLLDREPPTQRDFWVAILGHELAHCLKGRWRDPEGNPSPLAPERVAEKWEVRVLDVAQRNQG